MPIVSGEEWSDEKKKIERAMGPQIAMASAAWDVTTTNRKSAASLGAHLREAVRRAETIGEDVVTPFWPSDYRAKNK